MEMSKVALEECIRSYEREIFRKSSLESKASALLSTNAIVISILNSFIAFIIAKIITFDNSGILIFLNIIAIILIGFSIFWSLDVLKIKEHFFPYDFKDPNEVRVQLDKEEDILTNELIDRYLAIIPQLNNFNDSKVLSIKESRRFLFWGISISFVGLIITICLNGGV